MLRTVPGAGRNGGGTPAAQPLNRSVAQSLSRSVAQSRSMAPTRRTPSVMSSSEAAE